MEKMSFGLKNEAAELLRDMTKKMGTTQVQILNGLIEFLGVVLSQDDELAQKNLPAVINHLIKKVLGENTPIVFNEDPELEETPAKRKRGKKNA